MTINETIYHAMKAATWERAKGELRALVGIKGAVRTEPTPLPGERFPHQDLQDAVEAFIANVEDNGLHE